MTSPLTPSRSSSFVSSPSRSQTPYNVPNAALAGALNASARPGHKQHAVIAPLAPGNGARPATRSISQHRISNLPPTPAALTHANTGRNSSTRPLLDREASNASSRSTTTLDSALSRSSTPGRISRPLVSRSASLTAATIAAANYQKKSPNRAPQNTPVHEESHWGPRVQALQLRLNERMVARHLGDSMDNDKTDLTPIEPTKSLVNMFEQQSGGFAGARPSLPRPLSVVKAKPPPIVAPKPQRAVSVQKISPELSRQEPPPKPKPAAIAQAQRKQAEAPPSFNTVVDTSTQSPKPNIPPLRRVAKKLTGEPATAHHETASLLLGLPRPSSARPVSRAPSVPPPSHILPSNPARASPAPYKDASLNMLSPHMTGDSLANAMVGANLAIKSTTPPKRSRTPPPLPLPRRKNTHNHDLFHHRARSLSPQKKQPGKLRTTLRTDEVDEKQRMKKHHFRQPNKHHEGTRERWRDFVSDAERKRYEGVWAANKGLYILDPSQADEVSNLVAKDIWSRSRLPADRLAMVWDLVTTDENNRQETASARRTLTRDQFVVALWLIDQMLKGRNLPHSVNASVWSSVRLFGVKVRLEGKGKDGRKLERGTVW